MTKLIHLNLLVPKTKGPKKKGVKKLIKKIKKKVDVIVNDRDVKDIARVLADKNFRHGSGRLAGSVGSFIGRSVGRSLGIKNARTGAIGRQAGVAFSKITGYGDYTVSDNTLLKPSPVPDFGTQSIRVTHKEFLGNIYGSSDFVYTTYPLNPGVSKTFPWLAGIARNYQQYHINGLIFQYVSTSAFALGSTNSALGKVMLATNYNAEDPAFSSTVQMMATQYSNYCRPADGIMHAIECAPSETPNKVYYIRTDISEDAKDLRLSDIGFTEVATEGMQSTSEVGGLWVSYDITLLKPILNPQIAQSTGFDQFDISTMDAKSNPPNFFDADITVRNNRLGGDLITMWPGSQAYTYHFPATVQDGMFLLLLEVSGTPNTKYSLLTNIPWHYPVNCQAVTDITPYGPFNSKRYQVPIPEQQLMSGIWYEAGARYGETSIFGVIVDVHKNPATISFEGVVSIGTDGIYARLHVFPISYDPTADPSKNS